MCNVNNKIKDVQNKNARRLEHLAASSKTEHLRGMLNDAKISKAFPNHLIIPVFNFEYLPNICNQYLFNPDEKTPAYLEKIKSLEPEKFNESEYWLILPAALIQEVAKLHQEAILKQFAWSKEHDWFLGDDTFYDYLPDAITIQQFLALANSLINGIDYNQQMQPIADAFAEYEAANPHEDEDSTLTYYIDNIDAAYFAAFNPCLI